jgi:hypothetical protein
MFRARNRHKHSVTHLDLHGASVEAGLLKLHEYLRHAQASPAPGESSRLAFRRNAMLLLISLQSKKTGCGV